MTVLPSTLEMLVIVKRIKDEPDEVEATKILLDALAATATKMMDKYSAEIRVAYGGKK
jgi:hypothetical protein